MSKFQDPRTRCPRVGSGHPSGSAPGQRPPGEDPGAARLEADVSAEPHLEAVPPVRGVPGSCSRVPLLSGYF